MRYRTFALNFTVPPWPGGMLPGMANLTTTEPASLASVVGFDGRSDCAEPATYSSRPDRLSLIIRSDTSRFVLFL